MINSRWKLAPINKLPVFYVANLPDGITAPDDQRSPISKAIQNAIRGTTYSPQALIQVLDECYWWHGKGVVPTINEQIGTLASWSEPRNLQGTNVTQQNNGWGFNGTDAFFDGNTVPLIKDWDDFSISCVARNSGTAEGVLFAQYLDPNQGILLRLGTTSVRLTVGTTVASVTSPLIMPTGFQAFSGFKEGRQISISFWDGENRTVQSRTLDDPSPQLPNTGFIFGGRTGSADPAQYNQNLTERLEAVVAGAIIHPTSGQHAAILERFARAYYFSIFT